MNRTQRCLKKRLRQDHELRSEMIQERMSFRTSVLVLLSYTFLLAVTLSFFIILGLAMGLRGTFVGDHSRAFISWLKNEGLTAHFVVLTMWLGGSGLGRLASWHDHISQKPHPKK